MLLWVISQAYDDVETVLFIVYINGSKSTTTFLLIKSYFTCCPNHDVGSIFNYARPTRRFYQASNPRYQVHNSNHWATRVDKCPQT